MNASPLIKKLPVSVLIEDLSAPFQGIRLTRAASSLEIHQLLEGRRRLPHLSMVENPIHDLVLECETLHLAHGIGVLLISALHCGGIPVCPTLLLQPRVRAL